MFLLGMYAVRRGIFPDTGSHAGFLRRVNVVRRDHRPGGHGAAWPIRDQWRSGWIAELGVNTGFAEGAPHPGAVPSLGLGLDPKLGQAPRVVSTLVIYSLQAAGSVWWVRHFRFGPAEWLWRSLTYGRRQSMALRR